MKSRQCQIGLTGVCQSKFTVVLAACLVVSGCFGGASGVRPEERASRPEAGLSIDQGMATSATGCRLSYRWYRPVPDRAGDLVVLGHGFLRHKEHLDGLARALARSGIPSVTLDFCRTRPWSGNHFRHGLDMIRVADALGARRVVHAGFSAGGLAALVAGRNDPRTLGVVTLDLVDTGGLGRRMSVGLDRPLVGLVGEPSSCNAYNNGLPVLAVGRQVSIRHFAGAGHCDFESPTDWLCRFFCVPEAGLPAARRQDILRAAVAEIRRLMPPRAAPTRLAGATGVGAVPTLGRSPGTLATSVRPLMVRGLPD